VRHGEPDEPRTAKISSLSGLQGNPTALARAVSQNVDCIRRLTSPLTSDHSLAIIKSQLGIGATNQATSEKLELPQVGVLEPARHDAELYCLARMTCHEGGCYRMEAYEKKELAPVLSLAEGEPETTVQIKGGEQHSPQRRAL